MHHQASLLDGDWLRLEARQPTAADLEGRGPIECFSRPAIHLVASRKTDYLLPPSVQDGLNEDHLARFVVEEIDELDLSNLTRQYAGRGSRAHHPATLLAMLAYGYATGVFSSRKLETATYDSVAFRFIAANSHPDHDTLATFRRRFLDELAALFVQVLEMAQEMKLLKLGAVCLDGTKIHANASRHSAQPEARLFLCRVFQ